MPSAAKYHLPFEVLVQEQLSAGLNSIWFVMVCNSFNTHFIHAVIKIPEISAATCCALPGYISLLPGIHRSLGKVRRW